MYDDQGVFRPDINLSYLIDTSLPVFKTWQLNEEIDLAFLLQTGMNISTPPETVLRGRLVLLRVPTPGRQACSLFYNDDGTVLSLNLEWDPRPKLLTVTANPTAVGLPATTSQTFTLAFEAPGSTIVKLKHDLAIGARTASIVKSPYAGMTGHSGTGTFSPSDVGRCADKPATTKTDTFQIWDDLEQESNPKSLDSAMTYTPTCPTNCIVCGDPTGIVPCTNPAGCGSCGEPDGCGGLLVCECGQVVQGGAVCGNPFVCDTSRGALGCWPHGYCPP
jgi:hypothetical protein